MVKSCQLNQHLTEPLSLRPLQQALSQNVPEIHQSDQGVQYLSTTHISTLINREIEISLAHRGRPWENGYAERLIRTLKIVRIYNQNRFQSALGNLTPSEFEQQHFY